MRVIYEEVDNEDFFEIILSEKDVDQLHTEGVSKDFPLGIHNRLLNVFLRIEDEDQ